MSTLPVAFISHGSPMLALEKGSWRKELTAWAAGLEGVKGVVVVSAHWESSEAFLVTAEPEPGLLHDFSGFPEELYQVDYRAKGDTGLAGRVADLLRTTGREALGAKRPLDHGAWVPLQALFPTPLLPVVQVSLPRPRDPGLLVKAGQALAPLRQEGILLLGSGGIVHNLRRLAWDGHPRPEPWAEGFERWVMDAVAAGDLERLLRAEREAPGYGQAVPTPEHFDPLYFALGAAGADVPRTIHDSWQHGNLSLRALAWNHAA